MWYNVINRFKTLMKKSKYIGTQREAMSSAGSIAARNIYRSSLRSAFLNTKVGYAG